MLRALFLSIFSLALSGSALAQLKWEKPWQQFHRSPEDGHLEVVFAFQNTGTTTIAIKSMKTSCGCTTTRLDKNEFAPGERGELSAKFVFGDRRGPHRKMVTVVTNDKQTQELNFVVDIQQALTLTPALVFWKTGQPGDPKTVQLTATPGTNVRVKSVTSSNPRIVPTLQIVKAGEQYTVTVTPADTTQKESAELTVQTDFPPDAPRAYTIHARVK